MLVFKNN